jgi:uncharacterized protein
VIEPFGRGCGGAARSALAAGARPMGAPARASLFAICLLSLPCLARALVPVPPPTSYVTDLTGTLSAAQAQDLDQTLQAFEARKGSQLTVLIVPTTAPETIEQFGIRVGEKWKVGRKNVDDGAILIVAKDDRKMRIEVGYGLEGALTDETSGRIIREIIRPHFQQGDYYGGIRAGIDQMIRVVDGEPLPPPPQRRSGGAGGQLRVLAPIFFVLILVVGGFARATLGRFPGAIVTGGVLGVLAWLIGGALAVGIIAGLIGFFFTLLAGGMAGPMIAGSRYGGWGGGLGGGFAGGFGGGGGGFSGGGGGFGGGGASGGW